MDNDPAGEIERPEVPEPAARPPDPVGERIVDQRRPEKREDQEGRKLHPLRERPDDQRRCDDRKHRLEDHEGLVGDGGRVIRVRQAADEIEARPFQAADDPPSGVRPEGQGVAEENPLQADHADNHEALHQNGKDILPPDQPAVKESQPRNRHPQDQDRRYQNPRRVSRIHDDCLPLVSCLWGLLPPSSPSFLGKVVPAGSDPSRKG